MRIRKRHRYGVLFLCLMIGLILCGCQNNPQGQITYEEERVGLNEIDSQPQFVGGRPERLHLMTEKEATYRDFKYKSIYTGMDMCWQRYSGTGKGFSAGCGSWVEIKGGATQMIIWVGEETKEKLWEVQDKYPDTRFLWVNADPEEQQVTLTKNIAAISFRKEQGGYLAGYAAAINDQKKVGFIGTEGDWDSERYYYGFYQGLNDGAVHMAVENGNSVSEAAVELYCEYMPADVTEEDISALLDQWQAAGVQTILVGTTHRIKSADPENEIGLNQLCARESGTRGMEMIVAEWEDLSYKNVAAFIKMNERQAVYDLCCSHIENEWKGGETYLYDISMDSIVLEFAKVNYGVFTREDLRVLRESIADGSIQVNGDITVPLDESAYPYVTAYTQ